MSAFSRRAWLTGAAGTLALPLLDSLQARAADDGLPRRLVLFYNPNGTVPEHWFPTDIVSETEFSLGSIMSPLAHHRERLHIVGGVDSTVAQDPGNNGGPHQRGIGSLFTGQMLLEGEFADGCGKTAGWPDGLSIDQAVANHIGQTTPFRSLELGVRANVNDVQGRISYSSSGSPLPPTNSPLDVYNRIFQRTEPLDPNNPDSRRQSVIDTVKEQFRHLDAKLGRADQEKLGKHLALVEDLERRLSLPGTAAGGGCIAPTTPPDLDEDNEETMDAISRLHLDLLATAFACDLTRVASVQYSTGFNRIRYPWSDAEGEGHSLSHAGDSNAKAWDTLTTRATWHAGEIAYFLDRLAEIPEGEGTVLDNTLVVWGNEISKGNSHSLDSIPYLLAGSVGGAVRGGRFIDHGGASSCDLLHAIVAAFGVELPRFGHPDHASGILPGILA